MPNFAQCHRCRMMLPRHYLTIIVARGNSSGKVMKVLVCNACRNAIIREQQRSQ